MPILLKRLTADISSNPSCVLERQWTDAVHAKPPPNASDTYDRGRGSGDATRYDRNEWDLLIWLWI